MAAEAEIRTLAKLKLRRNQQTADKSFALIHSGLSSDHPPVTEVEPTKRRTEITVETHRVVRISGQNVSATAWCERCGDQVWMISPEHAAVMGDLSTRLIYRWVEDGRLHLTERPEGPLVCVNSLKASITAGLDERKELQ